MTSWTLVLLEGYEHGIPISELTYRISERELVSLASTTTSKKEYIFISILYVMLIGENERGQVKESESSADRDHARNTHLMSMLSHAETTPLGILKMTYPSEVSQLL